MSDTIEYDLKVPEMSTLQNTSHSRTNLYAGTSLYLIKAPFCEERTLLSTSLSLVQPSCF